MKKRPVNLERSDANIAEQYQNIYEGLQKDAAQNAWDARLTNKGKDWKLNFRYIHERNILVIEDFGTTGMDEDQWLKYQGLWDTAKTEVDTLGARGQGKFLFHYFSTDKVVLTETMDQKGKYRFSYGTTSEYDDESQKLQDFIPGAANLDHQGTRIWIMNIKPEFREDLLNFNQFMKYVAGSWWEIIRNYNATFNVNFDGVERIVAIQKFPDLIKKKTNTITIKGLGKVRNCILRYYNEEVPEEFRGIAIQRGGMTVVRVPVNADDQIKRRICGYCNFDDDLESELKKCEMPNHFGFSNKKAWNHVREFVRKTTDDFVLEITPKKERIEVSATLIDEAVKLVNELINEYAPELLTGVRKPSGPGPEEPGPHEPRDKPPLRIDLFRPNQRKYEYNETLLAECEIMNETDQKEDLILKFSIKNPEGLEKHGSKYSIFVPSQTRKKVDIQLIDFNSDIDQPGEYTAIGELINPKNKSSIHKKTFKFYLHAEPPKIGHSFVAKFDVIKGKKPDGNLQFFAKWKNLPINAKGVLVIIWDHPDFMRRRELSRTKKELTREMLLYFVTCGINEAFEKLLEISYSEKSIEPDKIRAIKQSCDEMLYEAAVRTE